MKRTFIFIGSILIIIISGCLFYWFQIRPSQVAKQCTSTLEADYTTVDRWDINYKICLEEHGVLN